jgi:RimJ/RimL family protein N-acetyltransferase
VLRPLQPSDESPVVALFTGLPREHTEYQRGHLCDKELAERFVRSHSGGDLWSIVAWTEPPPEPAAAVGMVTVHSATSGWRRHVGEIRVVVQPAIERQGLAATLVREAAEQAQKRGLQMLQALVLDSQPGLRKAIERLGFREEAVLHNHAIDHTGAVHDLLVYVNDVEALRRTMKRLLPEIGVLLRGA